MKIISHRGNIKGPNPQKENRPSYIDCAIQLNYYVEVDIRWQDNNFWLGHDEPQYCIDSTWMESRKDKLWFHCKNQEAAIKMHNLNKNYLYFCHSNDSYVLTSTEHLWVHDLNSTIDHSCIVPLLTIQSIQTYKNIQPFAVCTDFVNICKEKFIHEK